MHLSANISRVYFIGIGGIGMSALARYYIGRGVVVSGYDRISSENIVRLQQEGASVHFQADIDLLDRQANLVIYTPAVPDDHKELLWYRQHNFTVKKRSEALADITDGGFNICIAGTHGKTTTTTLTAHILRHCGYGCNAFLGGISVNYESNFWSADNNVNVVEADEYDRSFLRLKPDVALISAMDADHLDIYKNVENMRDAFYRFAGLVNKQSGMLLTKFGLQIKGAMPQNHLRYSLQNDAADVYAKNITIRDGSYCFDICGGDWELTDVALHMGGMHNVENAVASAAIAHHLKIEPDKIKSAISDFRGVHRRFEYIVNIKSRGAAHNLIYIDDYAHHPNELGVLLRGARSLFSKRWVTVIFQPHLYSRTRDLHKEFSAALSLADTVILMPVYPARELPIAGVTSEIIASEIQTAGVMIKDATEVLQWVEDDYLKSFPHSPDGDVLITAGAGDIDRLVKPIQKLLLNL